MLFKGYLPGATEFARKAEKSGKRETALKEYKKVLTIDPNNKTARYELLILEGLSLYKKGSN